MYIAVFIILLVINVILVVALSYIISATIDMWNAYMSIRKLTKLGVKKEMVLITILAVSSTFAYTASYVMMVLSFIKL